jgi:hypothetical protein
MTTNIVQGNTAQFVAEFLDSNGNVTIPSGGTLNITYPTNNQGTTTASTAIAMTQQNSFFTATWSSSVSSLGLGTWNITATGTVSTSAQAQGTLRIITP